MPDIRFPGRVLSVTDLPDTSLTLPQPLSTLLAVPIPSEHSTAGAKVQEAVEQAVRESVEQGIDKRGKEVTPWLLKRVGELTTGSALELSETHLPLPIPSPPLSRDA
jgi:pseudouridine-5'-phosphate glycosidase/pseudouridine kinase